MNAIIGFLFVAFFFFVSALLSTVFGAAVGGVVGIFFEDTIRGFLHALGINADHLLMWQIGAGLGFVGSFFRSVNGKSNA